MPGTASISGVVSGMKTDEIISKIMELERTPVKRLQIQQSSLKAKLAAWQETNTRILALKMKTDALSFSSKFDVKDFTTSDESLVTGSAGTQAIAGTYYVKINALARAHQIKTQTYPDTNATTIGDGSISIKIGDGAEKSITIDASNNTLMGVRDAINKADAGVTAGIINEGSEASPSYRLIVTGNTSGSAGQVTITQSLAGGTEPTFSTMQAAQDASITLGDGAGAVTVLKSTNTVTDLIPGVTLNLKNSDINKTATLTIQNNTTAVKKNIQEFVEQYNNLMDFMKKQFSFDTETKATGTLFTDSNLQRLQADLRSKISNPIAGLDKAMKILSQIGITSTTDDKLVINESILDKALTDNLQGVKELFATFGETTDQNVSFISANEKTKISPSGYAIQITAAATHARATAGAVQTDPLASNETLTINGAIVELTAGMTQSQVIIAINNQSSKTGVTASATDASGSGAGSYLTLNSSGFGSGQKIAVKSSVSNGGATPLTNTSGIGSTEITEANAAGQTGTGTGAAGVDVAGTINGEQATGNGQTLAGNKGNSNTEGLKVRITASAAGSYGVVKLTKGFGAILSEFMNAATDSSTGAVMTPQTSIQEHIKFIDTNIADMEKRLSAKEERLAIQFAQMESAMSKFQGQGNYLSSFFSQD